MPENQQFMQQALDLASHGEGRTRPNPPVGAVIVRDGRVVGRGFHAAAGEPHAEINALRQAGDAARGADVYVTLEPCAHRGRTGPCTAALIEAGVRRVFVGCVDPNPHVAGGGVARLAERGIEVTTGVLESECRRLIAPFAKHVRTRRPFVTLKAAVTLDGKTATVTGESQWITSPESRAQVHRLRDRVDAIMVGVGTLLRDNPRLTTRLEDGKGADPWRIVVDSTLRTPPDAAMLRVESDAPTLIATTPQAPISRRNALEQAGAEVLVCNAIEGEGVDLHDLMRQLGERNLMHLLIEGGATLNQSLLQAGLIDRLMLYVGPLLFGGNDGKGLFAGHGCSMLAAARRLVDLRTSRIGGDLLIEGELQPCLPG